MFRVQVLLAVFLCFLASELLASNAAAQETQTQTIYLQAQPVVQGPRPFTATWPPAGVARGRLVKLEVPRLPGFNPTVLVFLVKAGRSTGEVHTDPDAYVTLKTGESTTPDQLAEVFGAKEPKLPITILACVGALDARGRPVLPGDQVPIRITFTRD
jgi:hypothetical protein